MRNFTADDGRDWRVQLDTGHVGAPANGNGRIGWEAVLFDPISTGVTQRIAFRPAGWLLDASVEDLVQALGEAAAVRARWHAPRR
ncbi:MAG TPA: hypothetical protein VK864_07785 [Longimicrobiales bacterium]|nr:hypothetical protein [Longimicrobiales bacterium]